MNCYPMPIRNSCTVCGAILEQGDPVFAENYDQVKSGRGNCAKCAGVEPEDDSAPAPEDPTEKPPLEIVRARPGRKKKAK